jgi:hypothetical protein
MYVCMYVYTYVYMYVYTYECMYVYTYVCMFVCVCHPSVRSSVRPSVPNGAPFNATNKASLQVLSYTNTWLAKIKYTSLLNFL